MKRPFSRRDFLARSAKTTAAISVGAAVVASPAHAESQARIKIGQIGVGHSHAEGKMKVFRRSPDFEVVGVVESDPDLRQEAIQKETYRDLKWMTQEELLNVSGLQAVAVETDVSRLLPTAESCAAAGKHVHLDKPPGESLSRFRRILENVDRQGLTLQMGYMYRYVADARDFARIIRGEKAADWTSRHDLAVQETLLKACGMPVD